MGYSDVILADAPVGLWLLQEASGTTAANASGGTAATYTSSGITYRLNGPSSQIPYAIKTNGTSGWVQFPNMSTSLGASKAQSHELWVLTDAVTSATPRIILWGSDSADFPFLLGSSSSYLTGETVVVGRTEFTNRTGWGPNLSAGWHHLVVTYAGTTNSWKLYIDGVETAALKLVSAGGSGGLTGSILRIGFLQQVGFSAVTVAAPAVYGVELSAAQVAAHYNAAFSTPGVLPPVGPLRSRAHTGGTVVVPHQPVVGAIRSAAHPGTISAAAPPPISRRDLTVSAATTTSEAVVLRPSGAQPGDLLILSFTGMHGGGVGGGFGGDLHPDWTLIGYTDADPVKHWLAYRICRATDPQSWRVRINGTFFYRATTLAFAGVDPNAPISDVNVSTGIADPIAFPAVTASRDDTYILNIAGLESSTSEWEPPPGAQEIIEGSGDIVGDYVFAFGSVPSGAHDAVSVADEAVNQWVAATIALLPLDPNRPALAPTHSWSNTTMVVDQEPEPLVLIGQTAYTQSRIGESTFMLKRPADAEASDMLVALIGYHSSSTFYGDSIDPTSEWTEVASRHYGELHVTVAYHFARADDPPEWELYLNGSYRCDVVTVKNVARIAPVLTGNTMNRTEATQHLALGDSYHNGAALGIVVGLNDRRPKVNWDNLTELTEHHDALDDWYGYNNVAIQTATWFRHPSISVHETTVLEGDFTWGSTGLAFVVDLFPPPVIGPTHSEAYPQILRRSQAGNYIRQCEVDGCVALWPMDEIRTTDFRPYSFPNLADQSAPLTEVGANNFQTWPVDLTGSTEMPKTVIVPSLDGGGGYLKTTWWQPFIAGGDDFTLEAWVDTRADDTEHIVLRVPSSYGGNTTVDASIRVNHSTTGLVTIFGTGPGGSVSANSDGSIVESGGVKHLALRYVANDVIELFVNGVLAGSAAVTFTPPPDTVPSKDSDAAVTAVPFVSMLATYDTALSAAQIAAHYRAGTADTVLIEQHTEALTGRIVESVRSPLDTQHTQAHQGYIIEPHMPALDRLHSQGRLIQQPTMRYLPAQHTVAHAGHLRAPRKYRAVGSGMIPIGLPRPT